MRRLVLLLATFACMVATTASFAVTEKEMDMARAIAAKAYLRYANDGSGYLDQINPRSLSDLEKSLKPKEKENIKAFKQIPVPADYPSWDKQKLVDYWSTTAFSSKGLLEKGRIGKARARKYLNAMTVAAPSAPAGASAPDAPAATSQAKPAETPESSSPLSSEKTAPGSPTDSLSSILSDPLAAGDTDDQDEYPEVDKAADHTWIYIIILVLLVGVVVALVVFASNVMKKNNAAPSDTPRSVNPLSTPEANAQREKFAATLTAKNEEIASLSKKIESLNSQNLSLKGNIEGLNAEIASLRSRLSEARDKISSNTSDTRHGNETPSSSGARTIYLGRANAKGIFVRADRNLNPGNSIYRLDTTDGYAGSFKVADNPIVWETALSSPVETLSGACVAPDITAVDGASRIVNDSSGTAIFEGGCWKVIRKAKIHYD